MYIIIVLICISLIWNKVKCLLYLFTCLYFLFCVWISPVTQMVKNLPAMQETQVQSLGWEDPHGEGNDNPLQYSCLENPKDRGAWWATVHGVTKSQMRLRDQHFHFHTIYLKSDEKGQVREVKIRYNSNLLFENMFLPSPVKSFLFFGWTKDLDFIVVSFLDL